MEAGRSQINHHTPAHVFGFVYTRARSHASCHYVIALIYIYSCANRKVSRYRIIWYGMFLRTLQDNFYKISQNKFHVSIPYTQSHLRALPEFDTLFKSSTYFRAKVEWNLIKVVVRFIRSRSKIRYRNSYCFNKRNSGRTYSDIEDRFGGRDITH